MADQLLDQVRDYLEGQIDFEGQRLAELISTVTLIIVGVIAFLAGYITQDIALTLWIGLAGAAATFLLVVPPMPFFNKHPLQWLPAQTGGSDITVEIDGKKAS